MTSALPQLPARPLRGHKGTFGTVAVLGGATHRPGEENPSGVQMIGGPALCALAALRAGAGLVRLALPEPALKTALAMAPEATGVALAVDDRGALVGHLAAAAIDELVAKVQCLAIGPGLGTGEGPSAAVVRAIGQELTPIVVDADGINCLSRLSQVQKDFHAPAILTPHVSEFDRLAPTLGIDVDPRDEPLVAADALAQSLGCVVVLKSSATAVSSGIDSWLYDEPNSVLGTAGTGDVLTGIIASLVAQHFKAHLGMGERALTSEQQGGLSLFDCARLGVAIHSQAARAWSDRAGVSGGMLASDLLGEIPGVVEARRGRAE